VGVLRGCPPPHRGRGLCPSPENFFLHFHVEMAHLVGYVGCKFRFYSMNKTVKIHKNPTDTSEIDAIKRGKQ